MKKILVVDDVDYIRKSIVKVLTDSDYECEACANGREAMDLVTNNKYDLLITDIMMPDVDGFELIDFVRKSDLPLSQMPILAISGGSKTINSDMALSMIQDQVSQILQKPFTKQDLLDALETVKSEIK